MRTRPKETVCQGTPPVAGSSAAIGVLLVMNEVGGGVVEGVEQVPVGPPSGPPGPHQGPDPARSQPAQRSVSCAQLGGSGEHLSRAGRDTKIKSPGLLFIQARPGRAVLFAFNRCLTCKVVEISARARRNHMISRDRRF